MMPKVKRILPQDTELLAAVERLEARIFPDPWSLRSICSAVCAPCTKLFGAFAEDGKLMGYLFFTQVLDTASIDNLAVAPAFRRQGVAVLLLDAALDGVEADIDLEVRASNAGAIALYRKYGFQECGIRKAYYENPEEDAILMCKPRKELLC